MSIPDQQPIEVSAEEWPTLSISELYDQMTILQSRYYMVLGMGKGQIADQINAGISRIQSIINHKQQEAYKKGQYDIR